MAVPAVTAHDNQVGAEFLGFGVDFHFGSAHDDMAMLFIHAVVLGKTLQLLTGLLVYFVLDSGEVHGDVATIGEAERLDDVNDMQLGAGVISNSAGSLHNLGGILAEIHGNQDGLVIGHGQTPSAAELENFIYSIEC